MIQRIERKNMDPANQNQQTGDNKSKKPENIGGEDWQSKFEGQRKVNRDLEKKLNEAYAKADKVDELEKQIAALQGKEAEYEAARKEQAVKDEALAAANQRILKAEVRAAASGKLTDPSDALRYLDLSSSPSRMTEAWTARPSPIRSANCWNRNLISGKPSKHPRVRTSRRPAEHGTATAIRVSSPETT